MNEIIGESPSYFRLVPSAILTLTDFLLEGIILA